MRTHRDQPNNLAARLGCRLESGGTIATDGDGHTGIPGVYAIGDAAIERLRSVANAIGTGSRAALALALDLVVDLEAPDEDEADLGAFIPSFLSHRLPVAA